MSVPNTLMQRWRRSLSGLSAAQVAELEDHVRAAMVELREHGLSEHEAFVVAAMRCGRPGELVNEYIWGSTGTLWAHRLCWGAIGALAVTVGMPVIHIGAMVAGGLALYSGVSGLWLTGITMSVFAALTMAVFAALMLFARRSFRLPVIRSLRVRRYLGYAMIAFSALLGMELMGLGSGLIWWPIGSRPFLAATLFVTAVPLALCGIGQIVLSRGASSGQLQWFVRFFGLAAVIGFLSAVVGVVLNMLVARILSPADYTQLIESAPHIYEYRVALLPVLLFAVAMWAGSRASYKAA